MKVLFLDIDGVLNSTKTSVGLDGYPHEPDQHDLFDMAAVGLIRRMCLAGDIKIVLSSSWRILHHWQDVGKALDLPVIDATPGGGGERGPQIQQWLSAHPDADEYAILDDDSDMLPGQMDRFIQTDSQEGLTWERFRALCTLFGQNPYARADTQEEAELRATYQLEVKPPTMPHSRRLFNDGWRAACRFLDREDATADGDVGGTGCPEFEAAYEKSARRCRTLYKDTPSNDAIDSAWRKFTREDDSWAESPHRRLARWAIQNAAETAEVA